MEAHKKARWGILPSLQRSSDSIKITILNINTQGSYSWAHSLVGRAPLLHSGGQEFDSPWVHQIFPSEFISEN